MDSSRPTVKSMQLEDGCKSGYSGMSINQLLFSDAPAGENITFPHFMVKIYEYMLYV